MALCHPTTPLPSPDLPIPSISTSKSPSTSAHPKIRPITAAGSSRSVYFGYRTELQLGLQLRCQLRLQNRTSTWRLLLSTLELDNYIIRQFEYKLNITLSSKYMSNSRTREKMWIRSSRQQQEKSIILVIPFSKVY